MAKGRNTRALAALGGLGAAAYMLGKQGKSKTETKDKIERVLSNAEEYVPPKSESSKPSKPTKTAPAKRSQQADIRRIDNAIAAREARLGGRDNSMMDELQGLSRLREDRGDMTETGSERIARKQAAAAGKMRDAYRQPFIDPRSMEDLENEGIGTQMVGAKKGGKVRAKAKTVGGYKSGGSVKSSASRRGDGCAVRGKTKGRFV